MYDWDNTLVMSKIALFKAYKAALAEWNIDINFEVFEGFIYTDASKYLREDCNFSEEEIQGIKKRKEEFYINDYFGDLIWNWPNFSPITTKYVIVTNTSAELVHSMIAKFDKIHNTEILKNVSIIGSYNTDGKTYKRKPDPELYIEAFKQYVGKMSVDDELHIYEDSPEGLASAATFLWQYRKRVGKAYLHHEPMY